MNTEKSIPARDIPEGELWVMRWSGYYFIACSEDGRLYTSDGCEIARGDEHDVVALHPCWSPDHDHGTLDQMPEEEEVWVEELDCEPDYVTAELTTLKCYNAQLAERHGYALPPAEWLKVIARPNYDPRRLLEKEDTDE